VLGLSSPAFNLGYYNDWPQTQYSGNGNYSTQNFTPTYTNDVVFISIACGVSYCDNNPNVVDLTEGGASAGCSPALGGYGVDGTNSTTYFYECTNLNVGDEYQVQVGNLEGQNGEFAIEVWEFPSVGQASISLPSGYSNYVCAAAANGDSGLSTSFSNNVSNGESQVGTQTGTTCTASFVGPGGALAGIGVGSYSSMSVYTSTSGTLPYSVTSPDSLVIAAFASSTTSNPSITPPSGCTLAQSSNYDSGESAIIYTCSSQAVNAYTFTAAGGTSMAVYVFNYQANQPVGYGSHDNGKNVFNAYFNGAEPTSSFTIGGSGSSINNNMPESYGGTYADTIEFAGNGGSGGFIYTNQNLPNVPNYYVVEDNWMENPSSTTGTAELSDGTFSGSTPSNTTMVVDNWGPSLFGLISQQNNNANGGPYPYPVGSSGQNGQWFYTSLSYNGPTAPASNTGYFFGSIGTALYSPTYSATFTQDYYGVPSWTNPIGTKKQLYLTTTTFGTSATLFINWERARTYPPNGAMPTESLGSFH
jgi:hypothetical protein